MPWPGHQPLRDWHEGMCCLVSPLNNFTTGARLAGCSAVDECLSQQTTWTALAIGFITTNFTTQSWWIRRRPAIISNLTIPLLLGARNELDHPDQQRMGRSRSQAVASIEGVVVMALSPMARHGRFSMHDATYSLAHCCCSVAKSLADGWPVAGDRALDVQRPHRS